MYALSGDLRIGEEMEIAMEEEVNGFFGIIKECGVSRSVFRRVEVRKNEERIR